MTSQQKLVFHHNTLIDYFTFYKMVQGDVWQSFSFFLIHSEFSFQVVLSLQLYSFRYFPSRHVKVPQGYSCSFPFDSNVSVLARPEQIATSTCRGPFLTNWPAPESRGRQYCTLKTLLEEELFLLQSRSSPKQDSLSH